MSGQMDHYSNSNQFTGRHRILLVHSCAHDPRLCSQEMAQGLTHQLLLAACVPAMVFCAAERAEAVRLDRTAWQLHVVHLE